VRLVRLDRGGRLLERREPFARLLEHPPDDTLHAGELHRRGDVDKDEPGACAQAAAAAEQRLAEQRRLAAEARADDAARSVPAPSLAGVVTASAPAGH
jgi:hypothetical protein